MAAWLIRAFGAAITDMRLKVVEEAWFGRTVTPRPLAERGWHAEKSGAEKLGWDRPTGAEREHAPSHEQDRGIDR